MRGGTPVLYFTKLRTRGIVNYEIWSERVWRTLFWGRHKSPIVDFFFLWWWKCKPPLSHPCREIVSRAVIAGSREDSNPISIWTITLPSGMTVHLFQFDGRGESFPLKQHAGPLYSGQWAQAGDWQTWAVPAACCCPGLNMPTPLKLAHEPSTPYPADGLREHERGSAFILLQVCRLVVLLFFFHFCVVWGDYLHPRDRTFPH